MRSCFRSSFSTPRKARTAGSRYPAADCPVLSNMTPIRPFPWLAIFALAALLAACQGPPPGASYFPLEAGHRWDYEITTERENNTVERDTRVMQGQPRHERVVDFGQLRAQRLF